LPGRPNRDRCHQRPERVLALLIRLTPSEAVAGAPLVGALRGRGEAPPRPYNGTAPLGADTWGWVSATSRRDARAGATLRSLFIPPPS
jgi:hypothetical protein